MTPRSAPPDLDRVALRRDLERRFRTATRTVEIGGRDEFDNGRAPGRDGRYDYDDRRGQRRGRPDGRGPAGLMDDVRAVVAQADRRHLLGGHRNRRRMDRIPRRRGAIGEARRR